MSGEELRVLAQAATPGLWVCYGDPLVWPSDKGPAANDPIAGVGEAHEECAAFIAAANPTAVLALLDERDALRAAVEHTHGALHFCADTREWWTEDPAYDGHHAKRGRCPVLVALDGPA